LTTVARFSAAAHAGHPVWAAADPHSDPGRGAMTTEDKPDVDNQYRLALGDDLPAIRGQASLCSFAYDSVRRALDAGAWESTTADAFSTQLTERTSASADAGSSCEEAFESRYGAEPAKVPHDDPRAQWP
jgi:hypothetical protein